MLDWLNQIASDESVESTRSLDSVTARVAAARQFLRRECVTEAGGDPTGVYADKARGYVAGLLGRPALSDLFFAVASTVRAWRGDLFNEGWCEGVAERERLQETPRFKHGGCPACVFLGQFEHGLVQYDLYFCKHSVSARYGDVADEYLCSPLGSPGHEALWQAARRVRLRDLVKC